MANSKTSSTSKTSAAGKAPAAKKAPAKAAEPKADAAKAHAPAKKRTHTPLHEVLKKLEKHPKLVKHRSGHK